MPSRMLKPGVPLPCCLALQAITPEAVGRQGHSYPARFNCFGTCRGRAGGRRNCTELLGLCSRIGSARAACLAGCLQAGGHKCGKGEAQTDLDALLCLMGSHRVQVPKCGGIRSQPYLEWPLANSTIFGCLDPWGNPAQAERRAICFLHPEEAGLS